MTVPPVFEFARTESLTASIKKFLTVTEALA